MTKPIVIQPEAEVQLLEHGMWWLENRDKAPSLFHDELERALALIAESPSVGVPWPSPGSAVRRVLLRKTRKHVYYTETNDSVSVVALWGASKGDEPNPEDL